jgi:hypothetical protein
MGILEFFNPVIGLRLCTVTTGVVKTLILHIDNDVVGTFFSETTNKKNRTRFNRLQRELGHRRGRCQRPDRPFIELKKMSLPSSRKLLLYNDLTLQLSSSSVTSMVTWELEDAIASFLNKEHDTNQSISTRHDCHLLDCERPNVTIQSALGIFEQACIDEDDAVNPPIQVHHYQATVIISDDVDAPLLVEAPHEEWTRQHLTPALPEPPVTDVMWVDLRAVVTVALDRPGACCHFLRSLLGISHSAHPWGNSDDTEYPVVCLLLPHEPTALASFRTTDACPSYFLHSTSRLLIPATNPEWYNPFTTTLLVYRKLPPRQSLTMHHPIGDDIQIPIGCLVETFVRQRDDDEDDDNNNDEVFQEYYRFVAPPYVSIQQDYTNLIEPLLTPENFQAIRQEAINIPQWTAWPETQHYSSTTDGPTWSVFPLCHCFPASQVERRKWIHVTCQACPNTATLLQQHLGDTLRTALFSRLEPETTLEAHTGWEDLANHVYRLHLPLVVPPLGLCGAWVDGCVETHEEGRPMAFDDSKVHRAFNYSQGERLVLILDLARPPHLPPGTATGGHTDELDAFINALT